jgi:OOP family OmpA-OmpF porin
VSSLLFTGLRTICVLALSFAGIAAAAEPSATVRETDTTGKVVASGVVPDGATKAAILNRLREIYGSDVVDNLIVDNVVMPPNWADYVQKLIAPDLKTIHHGQLAIDGTNVSIKGEVATEAARQQLVSDMATRLNPTYVVKSGLRTGGSSQSVLDQTLANRIIEFLPNEATLTPKGTAILDEMATALVTLGSPKLLIIGNTDASGNASANIQLSLARANAVKAYFASKGIDTSRMNTSGVGSAQPVASNATPAGRARNRRIEFKIVN